MFESRISAGRTEKLPEHEASEKPETYTGSSWSYEMESHAKKCVERYCELANKTTEQQYKVATPCLDDHQFEEEEIGSARIGWPGILWSVIKLAVRSRHGPKLVMNEKRVWCQTFITHVNLSNIAMWVIRHKEWLWLKINIGCSLVYFRKSNICANKLDVQEADICFTQCLSWRWFTHGWNSRSWPLGFGDRSVSFTIEPTKQIQSVTWELVTGKTTPAKPNSNQTHQSLSNRCGSRLIKREIFWFQCYVVCLWGQWCRDQDDH